MDDDKVAFMSTTMQTLIWGIAMTVVWGGIHFYIGHRLIVGSHLERPWSLIGWGFIAAHASLSPLAFFLGRRLRDSALLDVLQWTTYVGMGLFILLLTLLVAKDLVFVVAKWMGLFDPKDPFPDDPTRRTILTSGLNLGVFAASGVATGFGYVEARKRPTVEEVDVFVDGLHADLDGFRIVQISDMHVGPTLRRPFVETVVEIVNELDADLVAMTGDLADGWVPELREYLEPLKSMECRYGAYYCTGNHEWYWDSDAWKAEGPHLGMTTLANSHLAIDVGRAKLVVGGVDDYSSPRMGGTSDPVQALCDAPPHDFSILLAHQPKSCYLAAEAGWKLQLSGHTHGGQFYPWNFFVGLAHPFNAGYGVHEGMHVYVSRGTGYWGPPLRLGVPSEITLLRLRRR